MRESRRMKRMERNNKSHHASLNLIPMLDVLSVLVFFLLFHSFNGRLLGLFKINFCPVQIEKSLSRQIEITATLFFFHVLPSFPA